MLRYLGGGMALAVLLGAVAACDGRATLLNEIAESTGITLLVLETATSDAAVGTETTGRRAGGDSLAVLIEWHVDSVRQYGLRRCQPDDQPVKFSSERAETVLDGLESAHDVGAQTAAQQHQGATQGR